MRKLLLLALAACLAFAGCSSDDDKDDNTIRYDEAKGYLTNLASAKHGIIGRWSAGTLHREFFTEGKTCSGTYGNEILPYCTHTYELFEEKGKIYLKYRQITTNSYGNNLEVIVLTKAYLKYNDIDGTTASFVRVSEEPTP